jgi:hypothetical protein
MLVNAAIPHCVVTIGCQERQRLIKQEHPKGLYNTIRV